MSELTNLLSDFCQCVGLADASTVIGRRMVQVKGMEVGFEALSDDPDHFQIQFRFGAMAAGRALRVFRLMLEANLLVYAKDNAHFALDPDTGESVLLLRAAFGGNTTGQWLADTLAHYAEHGLYWKKNILSCDDEQFNGVASGQYQWLRA
jgi:Tir chaperone protein (CesT) family